jgi:hypothetical protein
MRPATRVGLRCQLTVGNTARIAISGIGWPTAVDRRELQQRATGVRCVAAGQDMIGAGLWPTARGHSTCHSRAPKLTLAMTGPELQQSEISVVRAVPKSSGRHSRIGNSPDTNECLSGRCSIDQSSATDPCLPFESAGSSRSNYAAKQSLDV